MQDFEAMSNVNLKSSLINYVSNSELITIKSDFLGTPKINHQFINCYLGKPRPKLKDILRWQLIPKFQRYKNKFIRYKPNLVNNVDIFDRNLNKIVWLGHASFLITLNGKNIIIDPIFRKIPLVRRKVELPFDFHELGCIDYILISHAHYDHMDKFSLKLITAKNPHAKIYCGLNNAKLINSWDINNQIIEAGWWQQYPLNSDNIKINFLPAQHWSNRSLKDRNLRLWGSFLIEYDHRKIYFMGDSAYEKHFSQIGEFFRNIDYAILGIGAYTPQNIMQSSHMNPAESQQAFIDLNAKYFIPMHYGTFILADEPFDEPIKLTREILSKSKQLCELAIGEIEYI